MVLHFATGARWWLKFVLAPMVGGGGVASFMLSATDRLDLTPPAAQAPVTAESQRAKPSTSPVVARPAVRAPRPQSTAPQAASGETVAAMHMPPSPSPAPQPVRKSAPASHPPYLYATDRNNERIPGFRIHVRKGAAIGIHWLVDPTMLTGLLHLRVENGNRFVSDRVVQASGNRLVQIGSPTRLVLTEVRPEGERDLAELNVTPD